jgi:hypothetical protein
MRKAPLQKHNAKGFFLSESEIANFYNVSNSFRVDKMGFLLDSERGEGFFSRGWKEWLSMKAYASILALSENGSLLPKRKGQVRTLPNFSSLSLDGIGTVHLHQGPQKVMVVMDERLLDIFMTEVKRGVLHMGFSHRKVWKTLWFFFKADKGLVDITLPEIKAINLTGKGLLVSDFLSVESLEVDLTGASRATLQGTISKLHITSSGTVRFDARNLATQWCSVKMDGAGTVELEVTEKLNVTVKGAGKVLYWGDPKVNMKVTGAGSVRKGED